MEYRLYLIVFLLSISNSKTSALKSSLTFVIDDTWSMLDDIQQVMFIVDAIFDTVMNSNRSHIEDFVLVTFNDPSVSFRTCTKDRQEFKNALISIRADGGEDCPEMAMTGIELALKHSREGSQLYVFTDAWARDYDKMEKVKDLSQKKQVQIVFVLTGGCSNYYNRKGYIVYEKLAEATRGQVFRMEKNELPILLQFVEDTIKDRKQPIVNKIFPAGYGYKFNMTTDGATKELFITARGVKPSVHVMASEGANIHVAEIIKLSNIRYVQVRGVKQGVYTVEVGSESETRVSITGSTTIHFQYGFSVFEPPAITGTAKQPVPGEKMYVAIKLETEGYEVELQEVQILLNDKVVVKKDLKLLNDAEQLYVTKEPILSPNHSFILAIYGYLHWKKNRSFFKRTSLTQIEPIKVLPEFETNSTSIAVKEKTSATIECKVRRGYPTPRVTWQFRAAGSRDFSAMDAEGEALVLPAAELRQGVYRCIATNSAGQANKTTQLTVLVPPQFDKDLTLTAAKENMPANIQCKVREGNPPPTVLWQFRAAGSGAFARLANKGEVLRLAAVRARHAGHYRCTAQNLAGRADIIKQLIMLVPPEFEKNSTTIAVKEKTSATIECKVRRGYPTPRVTWQFRAAGSRDFSAMDTEGEALVLPGAELRQGVYRCIATNSAGQASKTTYLTVLVLPEFKNTSLSTTVIENMPENIECKVRKGNPPPTVLWQFRAAGSGAFAGLTNEGEVLRLPAVGARHAGHYRCTAQNSAGRAEITKQLIVLVPPEIENTSSVVKVRENSTTSIQCSVSKGFPVPTVAWQYRSHNSVEYVAFSNVETYVQLKNIQLSNAGEYKCVAKNVAGEAEHIVQVIVEAPPRIVFIPPNSPSHVAVEGDVIMTLPCTATGYPDPEISWTVDEAVISHNNSMKSYVNEDGALIIKNPDALQSSNHSVTKPTYLCHAKNELGADEQLYEVYVSDDPKSSGINDIFFEANKKYTLNCSLQFTDPNSVKWFYEKELLDKRGPTLYFDALTKDKEGNYTCRVSDENGAASVTFQVKLGSPPMSWNTKRTINWSGDKTYISCSVDQDPIGEYEWRYNGRKIKEETSTTLVTGWGQYVCRVVNPLGSLELTYNVTNKDCVIGKKLTNMKNTPLILEALRSPNSENLIVSHSNKLNLVCQNEKSENNTKSKSGFRNFPNSQRITVTCDHEDLFLVDEVPYKFSELDCEERTLSSVVPTGLQCMGKNTILMKIGFKVDGYKDLYESCVDTVMNLPLYTVVTNVEPQYTVTSKELEEECVTVGNCCYKPAQLVNRADFLFGAAEEATLKKSLNYVYDCKENDTVEITWYRIDNEIRQQIERSTVWSGASNYTKKGNIFVPQYLWKVVKNLDTEEITAIVHYNGDATVPRLCEDVCGESSWFAPYGNRTYCCKLTDFKKAFNIHMSF